MRQEINIIRTIYACNFLNSVKPKSKRIHHREHPSSLRYAVAGREHRERIENDNKENS